MNVILAAKRPEARDVTSFMFRSASPMKWQAGQFLQYSLPDTQGADERGMTRYFTIASAPFEGQIMLTTRFASERSSTFKRALQHLPVGAAVVVGEPDGDFVVADPANKHVFIAGGIGITRRCFTRTGHRSSSTRRRSIGWLVNIVGSSCTTWCPRSVSPPPRYARRWPTSHNTGSTYRGQSRLSNLWPACSQGWACRMPRCNAITSPVMTGRRSSRRRQHEGGMTAKWFDHDPRR
jgi:hypothetical protein